VLIKSANPGSDHITLKVLLMGRWNGVYHKLQYIRTVRIVRYCATLLYVGKVMFSYGLVLSSMLENFVSAKVIYRGERLEAVRSKNLFD